MLTDAMADEVEEREAEKRRLKELEARQALEKKKAVKTQAKESEEAIYHF